jgi:branched-chain amino acid transport system permease protein
MASSGKVEAPSRKPEMAQEERTPRVGHWNRMAVSIFVVFIIAVGLVEMYEPFGFRFRDFTGGLVTFDTLIRIGIFTIVILGLNLLMGYGGQISLGHAAMYGLGAYASAILSTLAIRHDLLPGISRTWWWPWLAILAGMLVAGLFAYAIGKPVLRLRGNYLAMATLGIGVILYTLFREGGEITGGNDGISGIPRLAIGNNFVIWPIERYYFLVWGIAILVIIISLNIVNSRVGRALQAIHGSEVAARIAGVDTARSKLQIFVVSAMIASLAGSLYAHFQALVAPKPFDFVASVEFVTMAAVGGLASVWGAPFGVAFVLVGKEMLRSQLHVLLRGAGGEHELIAYGIILVLIMIFVPQGLMKGLTDFYYRWQQSKFKSIPEKTVNKSSSRFSFKLRR